MRKPEGRGRDVPWLSCLLVGAMAGPGWAAGPEPITVHFHVRPPYMVTQPDGSPGGLTGTRAKAAFAAAKLPVHWQETPASRQLVVIEGNGGRDCGVGWFKNPARERFARFSQPLYRDLPWAVISGRQFKLTGTATLAQVLNASDMKLLVKDKYSYGGELDRKIAQFAGEVVVTPGDWTQIIGMLSFSRADFMFATQEEASFVLASEKAQAAGLKMVLLSDGPAGEYRYLMCSKQVLESEMQALDLALNRSHPGP